jgi:hypothetical protein
VKLSSEPAEPVEATRRRRMGIFDRAKDTATTKRDPGDGDHVDLEHSGPEQGGRPVETEVTSRAAGTEGNEAEDQESS